MCLLAFMIAACIQNVVGQNTTTVPTTTAMNFAAKEAYNLALLSRFPGQCVSGQFDCGEKCIPVTSFHDCVNDCAEGWDEACWAGLIKCDGCRCVEPDKANRLCLDRSLNCPTRICSMRGNFKCHVNTCICVLSFWLMDGTNDCGDWTDENICIHTPSVCPADATCTFIIPNSYVCQCPVQTTLVNGLCAPDPTSGTLTTSVQSPTISTSSPIVSQSLQTATTTSLVTQSTPALSSTMSSASATLSPVSPVQPSQTSTILPPSTPTQASKGQVIQTTSTQNTSIVFAVDRTLGMQSVKGQISTGFVEAFVPLYIQSAGRYDRWLVITFDESHASTIADSISPTSMLVKLQQMSFGSTASSCNRSFSSVINSAVTPDNSDGIPDSIFYQATMIETIRRKALKLFLVLVDSVCSRNRTVVDEIQGVMTRSNGELIMTQADSTAKVIQYISPMTLNEMSVAEYRASNDSTIVPQNINIDKSLNTVFVSIRGKGLTLNPPLTSELNVILNTTDQILAISTPLLRIGSSSGPSGDQSTLHLDLVSGSVDFIKVSGHPNEPEKYSVQFSPNPFSANPMFVNQSQLFYGIPCYVVFQSNQTGNFFSLSDITVTNDNFVDVYTGQARLYTATDWKNYFVFGPLQLGCDPVTLKISGVDHSATLGQRVLPEFYAAEQGAPFDTSFNSPGCSSDGFACGDGYCVHFDAIRNCRADCPNGRDEYREMTPQQCSIDLSGCNTPPISTNENPLLYEASVPTTSTILSSSASVSTMTLSLESSESTKKSSMTTENSGINASSSSSTSSVRSSTISGTVSNSASSSTSQITQSSSTSTMATPVSSMTRSDTSSMSTTAQGRNMQTPSEAAPTTTMKGRYAPDCIAGVEYSCKNGLCQPFASFMNGVVDCADHSDEDPGYVDECYLGISKCHKGRSYCKNIPNGLYECVCLFGYEGNGFKCTRMGFVG